MPTSEMSNELKAALDAARAAAEVIRGFYQRNVKIEVKADKTPVTEADVRSEEAIRELLTQTLPDLRLLRRGNRQVGHERRKRLAGRSHRRHEILRARVPVLFHADRADARRQIRVRRLERAGIQRARVGGDGLWRVSQWQADSREQGGFARRRHRFHRQSQDAGGVSGLVAFRRTDRRHQPHPRLRRFRALPSAGARRARRRHRVGCEHPRHRGADRDRRRGRWQVHGSEGSGASISPRRPCSPPTGRCINPSSTPCASEARRCRCSCAGESSEYSASPA